MPISVTLSEGVIPVEKEQELISQITDAFLAHHGLTGNKVMTPNVTAHISVLPKRSTFAGGKSFSGAWIEVKVPSFGLAERNAQKGFLPMQQKLSTSYPVEANLKKTSIQMLFILLMEPGIWMERL